MSVWVMTGLLLAGPLLLLTWPYLAPQSFTRLALRATRRRAGLVRREARLGDGSRCVYLQGGSGEPLMLLHGFGGNKDTFTRVAADLSPRYRLIIPDISGFAESGRAANEDYSLSAQVQRLRALAQHLSVSELHLGGNSMGGQLALQYAAQYPAEVKSLWLISPSGIWSAPPSAVLNEFRRSGRNPLIARSVAQFKAVMALGMLRPPFIPGPVLRLLAQERIKNAELEEKIFAPLVGTSMEERICGLPQPTLVMFGEQDGIVAPQTADVLCELLPHARGVRIANAGHVCMFEQPHQCAQAYLAFRESAASENPGM